MPSTNNKNDYKNQQQAQATVQYYAQIVKQAQAAEQQKVSGWTQESIKTHGQQGVEEANRAIAKLASPGFAQFLKESGLGNHPEMVATFRKAFADHKEGDWVDNNSTTNSGVAGKPDFKSLYPNSGY